MDARWTVKFAKARIAANGKSQTDIAIPSFGDKNHIAIDRRFGFICKAVVTHSAHHHRSQLREVVTINNTVSDVWADTAYRLKANEAWLKSKSRVSRIHRKKPKGSASNHTVDGGARIVLPKLNALLQRAVARSFDAICDAVKIILEKFKPTECVNYLKHTGYVQT